MFTGLIKDIGTIKSISPNPSGKEIVIETTLMPEIGIDDSVAVNGCCLTATKLTEKTFTAQAVHVTLEKTSLGELKIGSKVNLELALRASDRLGGHFVQGHVNGLGKFKGYKQIGNNYEVDIEVPATLKRYMIQEGSIAFDGISLTLARVNESNTVTVSIIPHTWQFTNLSTKKLGDRVNVEVDVLAKYIENFILQGTTKNKTEEIYKEFLQQ